MATERRASHGAVACVLGAVAALGGAPATAAAVQAPAVGGAWVTTFEVHGGDGGAGADSLPGAAWPQVEDFETIAGQPRKAKPGCGGDAAVIDTRRLRAYQRELMRVRGGVDGDVQQQIDALLQRLEATIALAERDADARARAQREVQLQLRPEVERLANTMTVRAGTMESGAATNKARGWLGVNTAESSIMRWTSEGRVVTYCAYPVVVSVEPASPAERAGIAAGDTLVAYDGRDLVRSDEVALDRLLVPGRTMKVTVRRGGRKVTRRLVVGERGDRRMVAWTSVPAGAGARARAATPDGAVRVRAGTASDAWMLSPEPLLPTTPRTPATPMAHPAPTAPGGPGSAAGAPMRAMDVSPLSASPPTWPDVPAPPPAPAPPRPPRPPLPPAAPLPPMSSGMAVAYTTTSVFAGAQLVELDDEMREALGTGDGVLVWRVLPDTPAARAGLRRLDVIRRVDGHDVRSPWAVQRMVTRGSDQSVRLEVERKGAHKQVVLKW